MIRQALVYNNGLRFVFVQFFVLTWLPVANALLPPSRRFQILHLNFQTSNSTGAVIYCLRVGFLWLGKFLSYSCLVL